MDSGSDSDASLEEISSTLQEEVIRETNSRPDIYFEWIKENDPDMTTLHEHGSNVSTQVMTNEEWEQLGRDISDNTYLDILCLEDGALNDHKMSFLFRGLTSSSSIEEMNLNENGLSVEGIRSMVPFLQNANNLRRLNLDDNNIQSEGINVLLRALRDRPVKTLSCNRCGIESIEIDRNNIPQNLECLRLDGNNINTDGCRELAKLLHGANATLTNLWLDNNNIDDKGVAILVDSLQYNTSLETLDLENNGGITMRGKLLLLKLVCDISSIKATLQSNHTLRDIFICVSGGTEEIRRQIDYALNANKGNNPETIGREKVIRTQLNSGRRAALAKLQGVDRSLYSEINPLHLPEVLALVGRSHGQGELYAAVSSSIMTLFSTVNRKKCIQQQREYHAAIVKQLDAEITAIEAAEGNEDEIESQGNKRLRT